MYIDPNLAILGMLTISNAINNQKTEYHHTHSITHSEAHSETPKISEKLLAEEIVRAQQKQKDTEELIKYQVAQELKTDLVHQLCMYSIEKGSSRSNSDKEMKELIQILSKHKPELTEYSTSHYQFRIFPPNDTCKEYFVVIGEKIVSAFIFELYMFYFRNCLKQCYRANIDGNIYFIIEKDFAEQRGWNIEKR